MLIVLGSMSLAFALGIQTAGDVNPVIDSLQADGSVEGDFNGNGQLDVSDVRIALEIANGYLSPTPEHLAADPNNDYRITVDDALAILNRLEQALSTPKVQL